MALDPSIRIREDLDIQDINPIKPINPINPVPQPVDPITRGIKITNVSPMKILPSATSFTLNYIQTGTGTASISQVKFLKDTASYFSSYSTTSSTITVTLTESNQTREDRNYYVSVVDSVGGLNNIVVTHQAVKTVDLLKINPTSKNISASGQTVSFPFSSSSNQLSVTALNGFNWTTSVSYADHEIQITAPANTSSNSRTARFRVSTSTIYQDITIVQAGNNKYPIITCNEADIQIGNSSKAVTVHYNIQVSSGGLLTINGNSNVSWIAASSNPTPSSVTLNIAANTSGTMREGQYTIMAKNTVSGVGYSTGLVIKVRQGAAEKPYLKLYSYQYNNKNQAVYNNKGQLISSRTLFETINYTSVTSVTFSASFSYPGFSTSLLSTSSTYGVIIPSQISENNIASERTGTVTVTYHMGSTTATDTFYIKVEAGVNSSDPIEEGGDVISKAIWIDEETAINHPYFRLYDNKNQEVIYKGKIYSQVSNKVNIHGILREFMSINTFPFSSTINRENLFMDVNLEVSDDNIDFSIFKVYKPFWNYTYDYLQPDVFGDQYYYNTAKMKLNYNPIDYYDERQLVPVPVIIDNLRAGHQTILVYKVNGNESQSIDTAYLTLTGNEYEPDVYNICVYGSDCDKIGLYSSIFSSRYNPSDYFTVATKKCTRADYCIYYLSPTGLWCWMLFEGKNVKKISNKQTTFVRNSLNDYSANQQNTIYKTTLTDSIELTSLYVTDEQSKKLEALYTSPVVYIMDLNTRTMYAAKVDTKTFELKTFRNQGKKYFTHSITVSKSIDKNIIV